MRYSGTHIRRTNAERLKGRLMRAPDGHDGGNQGGGGSNTGGDQSTSGGSSGNQNNNGQQEDHSSFWTSPSDDETKPPSQSGSAGNQSSSGGEPSLGDQIRNSISSLDFGGVNESVIQELGEGKFDSFNAILNQVGRKSVETAVQTQSQILEKFGAALVGHVQSMIDNKLQSRDNESELFKHIPSAKNPAIKPIAEMVYAQALKITGGKTAEAIEKTKTMLREFTQKTAGDVGAVFESRDDSDDSGGRPPENWLEDLMAAKS